MRGEVLFAFSLLIFVALFVDIFAVPAISVMENIKRTVANYIQCLHECPLNFRDPVCSYYHGKYLTLGRETYTCYKRTCDRGGRLLHRGFCNSESEEKLRNSGPIMPDFWPFFPRPRS